MERVDPVDLARRAGLVFAALLLIYYGMVAEGGDVLLSVLLFTPFQVGPVAIAALLARASRSRAWAWLFLAVELALILLAVGFFVDVRINRDHWTAVGGAMFLGIFGPLYEYGAMLALLALAWLVGWRPREDWRKA